MTGYDGRNRVNPPLRESSDTAALRQALADGVIDCVATDHAPHADHEKCCEFAAARPGMLGLQTALSVVAETMVVPGLLDWRGVAAVMSENPARIARLPDQGRPLEVGEPANLTIVDPEAHWTVTGAQLASRSANTPTSSCGCRRRSPQPCCAARSPPATGRVRCEHPTLVGSLIFALVLLIVVSWLIQSMMRGWRNRAARQAELVGALPPVPDTVGR